MGKEKHFVFHQGSWKIVGVERPFSKKSRIRFFFFFHPGQTTGHFRLQILNNSFLKIFYLAFVIFFSSSSLVEGDLVKVLSKKKLFNVFIIQNIFRCSRVQFLSHAPSFVSFHCFLIFLFGKLHPCF